MSEVATAVPKASAAHIGSQNRVAELKVSGHLMTLDTGLFCVFQAPGSPAASERSGLPGVRISLPPGPAGRPEAVQISTFREDGWMNSNDSAVLIRVAEGPAQVLVTVYQSPTARPESAPRLQVMRLAADASAASPQNVVPMTAPALPVGAEIVVHVQRAGDLPAKIGEWVGTRGSRQWIEGFSLSPQNGLKPEDIEYQAVLGRGWMSPWIEGGKFCGSRGMALPLLGLKVRLKGDAAKTHECICSATFVDGSMVGPVPSGESCEAESLAALEAFQLVISRRAGAATQRHTRGKAEPAPARSVRSAGRRSR